MADAEHDLLNRVGTEGSAPPFLQGGGEMGARMRAHDWAATPLGSPETWPQPLKTAIRLLLNTGHPMYIWWGPTLLCFYNDAYRQSIGAERHPSSLGRPGREVWDEIWGIIGPQIDQVMSGGGATWSENALIPITRDGRREDVYWTYSYGPIDDPDTPTGVGGVLVVCTETTKTVLGERHRAAEMQRQRRLFEQAPGFIIVMHGPDHVVEFINDAHRRTFDSAGWIGKPIRDAFPSIAGQGFFEQLDRVYATGELFEAVAAEVRYRRSPDGPEETRYLTFNYAPLVGDDGRIAGIFCEGYDATEQHTFGRALHHSEEQLRLATEAAEVGLWDVDMVAGALFWPPRVKAMFGISPDVPVSMDDFSRGLHPDDRDATVQAFIAASDPKRRALYDVEYRTIGREDGITRWVAAKGRGIFDEKGACVRVIGTAIDITDRKAAQAEHLFMLELGDALRSGSTDDALHRVSALMGAHFAVNRVGYGHLDPDEDVFDYTICWTDGRAVPLLGRLPAKAFGAKIVAKLSAGETVVVEDLLHDPLSDEAVTRATATQVDTRAILVVPFVRGGRLRTIVYLNSGPARRWTQDEVAFMEQVAERTRQVIERSEAEAALHALNATLESRVEQRTAELRAAEEALRQAQKMEAIGRLTGGVAHDFNNLLTIVTGGLDMIRRQLPKMPASAEATRIERGRDMALEGVRRAAMLTNRLLAFSRQQPLSPEVVDANELVAGIVELLRRTLGETVALETVLGASLWHIEADANQLESALLNLAVNARDALPNGGKVTIATANVELDAATSAKLGDPASPQGPGSYVSIAVSDTGIGMDRKTVERAFDPFFTTKEVGKGTGLGLSQVYGFVRQSSGHVKIDSTPGAGTTVTIYLKRSLRTAQAAAEAPRVEASVAPGRERILVVEDDEALREYSTDILKELGYTVVPAADAAEALRQLDKAAFDLLFTDIVMPGGVNGRQLADLATSRQPALKVLFTTGYSRDAIMQEGRLEPGLQMIGKPFAYDELAAKIRTVLDA
jgi:PAS domain S-box-containing protein